MNPTRRRAAAAQRARRSIRCARGWKRNWRPSTAAAAAIPPRTTRSAATRMPPPSSRANSIASPSQAKRMGCDSSGFFSLFSGQSAQCGPVNNQIQQMRANLDQITSSLERLRGGGFGGADRDNQRRSVLTALAQNNCGPQYANAAPGAGPGNFLNNLFGNNNPNNAPRQRFRPAIRAPTAPSASAAATAPIFRSRSPPCRPVSPMTRRPARRCARRPTPSLYAYRNPGEDINQAVSISGQPYTSLPNAFRYRQEFNPVLRLQGARTDLVGGAEKPRRQGRRRAAGRHHRHRGERQEDVASARSEDSGLREEGRHGHRTPPPLPPPTPRRRPPATTGAAGDKQIRTVGPTFIPAR